MKLYICSTYYHVYITLLKQFASPFEGDLIICDDLPTGGTLASNIRATNMFHNVWFIKQSELPPVRSKNVIDYLFFKHNRRSKILRTMLPFSVHNYEDIYIYHDGIPLGTYLNDERVPYHLIEDSLNFYQYVYQSSQAHFLPPHNLVYWIRRFFNAGYFPLGFSPFLLDIEVNNRSNLQIPSRKVIEYPRSRLEQISIAQIQLLYDLFGFSFGTINNTDCAIILTQPLFQDGICSSEEKQYLIYQELSNYLQKKGYHIFLKPHPRDICSYFNLPVKIIDRYFPSELFALQRRNIFDCAVTISSSSITNFPAKKNYYWDINKKCLYKKESIV